MSNNNNTNTNINNADKNTPDKNTPDKNTPSNLHVGFFDLVLITWILYILAKVVAPTCFYAVCIGIFCIVAIAFAPPLVLMSCIIETTCLDALPPLVGRYVADAITVVIVISFLGTWWFVLYDAHRKRNAKSQ
jgi:hypothetical protein